MKGVVVGVTLNEEVPATAPLDRLEREGKGPVMSPSGFEHVVGGPRASVNDRERPGGVAGAPALLVGDGRAGRARQMQDLRLTKTHLGAPA